MKIIKPNSGKVYDTETHQEEDFNYYQFVQDHTKYEWKVEDDYKPPTLKDFETFYNDKRLIGEYKQIYKMYEYGLWLDGKGKRIKDSVWKQRLVKNDLMLRNHKLPKPDIE